ncbi:DUF1947 domain-containing protein [Candidatus Bathyarchaeota archaeon]|nr:DUF1947 domain-containing protein [Candidatus Bathyarchaeota archaeon]
MKKRQFMGKRETREFLEKVSEQYGEISAEKIEFAQHEDNIIYILDDNVEFIEKDGKIIPFLGGSIVDRLPSVTVDMGAIRFVCNGADIMAPGITDLDDFKESDIVVIRDNTHGKPLAIGEAIKSDDDISSLKKGRVVSNLHYVGDTIWEDIS